jgi:hypothetical protein
MNFSPQIGFDPRDRNGIYPAVVHLRNSGAMA